MITYVSYDKCSLQAVRLRIQETEMRTNSKKYDNTERNIAVRCNVEVAEC